MHVCRSPEAAPEAAKRHHDRARGPEFGERYHGTLLRGGVARSDTEPPERTPPACGGVVVAVYGICLTRPAPAIAGPSGWPLYGGVRSLVKASEPSLQAPFPRTYTSVTMKGLVTSLPPTTASRRILFSTMAVVVPMNRTDAS